MINESNTLIMNEYLNITGFKIHNLIQKENYFPKFFNLKGYDERLDDFAERNKLYTDIVYLCNECIYIYENFNISKSKIDDIKSIFKKYTEKIIEYTKLKNDFIEYQINYMNEKIEIIKVFDSEISEHPFPRSIRNLKALGTLRGATAGCEYAESFMLLKEIN